jgi:hypothetical protein
MSEVNKFQFSVDSGSSSNSPPLKRVETLERTVQWIIRQGHDEYTTQGLIELAQKYPTTALPSFRKNYQLMLNRVRAKRKKEVKENVETKPIQDSIAAERKPIDLGEEGVQQED